RTVERRHLERGAKGGEGCRYIDDRDEIVALAHEAVIGGDRDEHVGVAGRRAELADVAAAGEANALTVGDAGRHLDVESPADDAASATVAFGAGVASHAAIAVADVARDRTHHLAERRPRHGLQATGPTAAGARLD